MTASRSYVSPKRAAGSQETAQRILAAARTLFAQRGYAATTIAAVAREAGVGVQTVYQHFGDKPALLRGQLDDIDRVADLGALIAAVGDPHAPPRRQLEAFARFLGQITETTAGLLGAIRTLDDPQLRAVWDGGMARHRGGAGRLAAQWAERGLLRDGVTAGDAALTLAATCSVAMFSELQESHGLSRTAAEAWIVEAALRLVVKDAAG